jgi:hypothetical protein
LSLEGTHALASPDFAVTPAMRDELFRRMRAKGIVIDRATYDAASHYVDQQLATEATRYVFGVDGLFTRSLTRDSVLVVAADLASRATSPADLLRLTTTTHK